MCGLISYYGLMNGSDMSAFRTSLILNQIRGAHSTGVGVVWNGGEADLVKGVGCPSSLPYYDDVENPVLSDTSKVLPRYLSKDKNTKYIDYPELLLGHGRYATVGDVTDGNAHPFLFKSIIGMHNGTMFQYSLQDNKYYTEGKTDSYAVLATLDELDGDKEGTEEYLSSLDGEFCFIWYSLDKSELYVFKNYHRPLEVCTYKDQTVYFASEGWMITKALERGANVSIFSEPKDVPNNILHTIKYSGGKLEYEKSKELKKKHFFPIGFTNNDNIYSNYNGWMDNSGVRYSNYEPLGVYIQPKNDGPRYLKRETWDELTSMGCGMCCSDLEWEDRLKHVWFDGTTPLCSEDCYRNVNKILEVG